MKKKWSRVLSFLLAAGVVISSSSGVSAKTFVVEGNDKKNLITEQQKQEETSYVEGEVIVLCKDTSSKTKTLQSGKGVLKDIEIVETYDFDSTEVNENAGVKANGAAVDRNAEGNENGAAADRNADFKVSLLKSDKYSTKDLIKQLESESSIQYIQPNYRIYLTGTDDTYAKYQWALENLGQNGGSAGADVKVSALEQNSDSEDRVIALVDTGIDYEHEDLVDAVWNNPYLSKSFKGKHGYDFVNKDDDPLDDCGHGTHCAGIMAASANNKKGIAGIATDSNIKIMALKVFDAEGNGSTFEAVGAYNYIYKAQLEGVNVVAVNNSWGEQVEEEENYIFRELVDLVGENGALSVCAAGNAGKNNDETDTFPCNIDSPYIVSVAATNEKDELAAFSNYGKEKVDLGAPGADILSSVNEPIFNPGIYENPDELCRYYEDFNGSSVKQISDNNGYLEGVDREENSFQYGIYNEEGAGEVTVETTKDIFFGEKTEQSACLKWTIKDAKEGDMYGLTIPYDQVISSTPTYCSFMLRISTSGPVVDSLEKMPYSVLSVSDSEVDEEGVYNAEKETVIDGFGVADSNYWDHVAIPLNAVAGKREARALRFDLQVLADGDYEIYLDDLGLSKENVAEEEFGKYDFYNGTSMAAPYVTGAVAAVSQAYPDDDIIDIKSRILGSVRKAEALENITATGGVLDLANVDTPGMLVDHIELEEDKLVIYGFSLETAKVSVNREEVEPIAAESSAIALDISAYNNETIELSIEKDGEVITRNIFISKGEKYNSESVGTLTINGGDVVSDGNGIYYIDRDGFVSYSAMQQEEDETVFNTIGDGFNTTMFGDEYSRLLDYTVEPMADYVYTNQTIYNVLKLDAGYTENTILAAFDENSGEWRKAADFPKEFEDYIGYTLAAYNGEFYLLGGLNTDNGSATKSIYVLKPNEAEFEETEEAKETEEENREKDDWNATWNKLNLELPEARYFAKALQIDNRLVITLGSNGKEDQFPANIVYDGKEFKLSKAAALDSRAIEELEYKNSENKDATVSYYDCAIGLVDGGVIYSGINAEKVGDTLIYNADADQFENTGFSLNKTQLYGNTSFITTVGDKLYVISGYDYAPSVWYGLFYKGGEKQKNINPFEYADSDEMKDLEYLYGDELIGIYSIGVEDGTISVTSDNDEGSFIIGAKKYLPGETVVLIPEAEEGYEIAEFKVNGELVEDDIWTKLVTDNKENIEATVTSKVLEDEEDTNDEENTSEDPNTDSEEDSTGIPGAGSEEDSTGTPGTGSGEDSTGTPGTGSDEDSTGTPGEGADEESTRIQGVTTEDSQKNPTTEIQEDDPKKTTETPTVKDGDSKTGNTTTEERKTDTSSTIKKGKVVTINNVKYKVTKSTASAKTVSVIGVKNKKVKKVTIPNTIQIEGKKYKVTAIDNNAFKNCKSLSKLTVGKNISKVGKNVVKGCKKLKKITYKSTKKTIRRKLDKQLKKR